MAKSSHFLSGPNYFTLSSIMWQMFSEDKRLGFIQSRSSLGCTHQMVG